jgi:Zn-finger nucleic acid-binding protein
VSAYREGFERCPRCAVALEDAGSTRACPGCRGLWVAHEVVADMIQRMLPPGALGRVVLAVVDRAERLPCPSCHDAMDPTTIHEVVLDACGKGHGVWFDGEELELALRAVAQHGIPEVEDEQLPVVFLRQTAPIEKLAERFRQPLIKIGRLASAHYRLDYDDVARMHAIIEVTDDRVQIIDLGSIPGTFVDGNLVAQADLHDGARLQFGSVTVEVLIEPRK